MEPFTEYSEEQNVHPLYLYVTKMRGGNRPAFQKVHHQHYMLSSIGSFLGIGVVAFLNSFYHIPLLVPSFGATAVLIYAACHAPMSQPRNVIGGHLISAMSGVLVYQILGNHWWTIAFGVTLAIFFMSLTHTLHPPGGATSFVAVYTGQGFVFILSPVGLGAVLLVIIALIVNNISTERKYPDFWF